MRRVVYQLLLSVMVSSSAPKVKHRVLFNRFRVPEIGLFMADGEGKNERALPHNESEYSPSLSADQEWIVYTSEQGGISDEEPLVQEVVFGPQMYGELFAYRLSDGLIVRLTHNKWEEGVGYWGPEPQQQPSGKRSSS